MSRSIYVFLVAVFFSTQLSGDYRISGTINLKGDWQNTVYLATINKLDDYYNANAANIINSVSIDEKGEFLLEGNNLPNHRQFYRLYLIKEEQSEYNACLFEGGEEHNFIHLLLDNESQIRVDADTTSYAPFGNYSIKGDTENQLMRQLGALVYPSYIFYEIKFPSELQFAQDKLNRDLFHFADTCSSTIVALAALNNTDFDHYFEGYKEQYMAFATKLKEALPTHHYTNDYFRKMRYYGEEPNLNIWQRWSFWTSLFLAGCCLFLYWNNRQLRQRLKETQTEIELPDISLTQQEQKILHLIVAGKSNKEIANELYVELSTVKSHINRIYSKLSVTKRSEAVKKAKSLKLL